MLFLVDALRGCLARSSHGYAQGRCVKSLYFCCWHSVVGHFHQSKRQRHRPAPGTAGCREAACLMGSCASMPGLMLKFLCISSCFPDPGDGQCSRPAREPPGPSGVSAHLCVQAGGAGLRLPALWTTENSGRELPRCKSPWLSCSLT